MNIINQKERIVLKSFHEKYLCLLNDSNIIFDSKMIEKNSVFILQIENNKATLKSEQNNKFISCAQDGKINCNLDKKEDSTIMDIKIFDLNKCTLKSSFGKFLSSQENGNIIADKIEVNNNEIFSIIYLDNNSNGNCTLNLDLNNKNKEMCENKGDGEINEYSKQNFNQNIIDEQNKIINHNKYTEKDINLNSIQQNEKIKIEKYKNINDLINAQNGENNNNKASQNNNNQTNQNNNNQTIQKKKILIIRIK